jgi:hypothetical protein
MRGPLVDQMGAASLTAAPAGKLGAIESMADWRIDELKENGV